MSMVPAITHPVWKKLATGEKKIQSTQLAVNMLLASTQLKYTRDPSPSNVQRLVAHIHEFFTKFEKTFQSELNQILG
jgi:hypothetical protein